MTNLGKSLMGRLKGYSLLLIILFCMLALSACDGYQGGVFVRKADGSIGQKITGTKITFVKEDGSFVGTVTSDSNGYYRISLTKGRYWVTAVHQDYEDYSSIPGFFVVTGDGFQTGNIFLRKPRVTTILLVRHAEKAPPQPDDRQTPLNQEGNIRAEKLVHVLRRACVTEVYATEYLRTQQTVQPLAGALKLSLKIYNGGDAAGLVNMILSEHNGDVVLVAGHSNTVPRIAAQFGANINGQQIISDYDNLLMVTHTRDKSNVINFQYGQSSHPDSPGMTACEMTTILLVRDVQAGPAGINRAQKLVHVGQKAGVTVIYSTSSNLSRNTVQPLANELNLNILNYDVNDVQSLIDTILSQHSGKVVLITGQRDTMYQIINKINGHPLSPIYINEYDNLFVLTVYRSGDTKVVNLQYGEESP